jgi:hypothetical protein
MKVCHTDKRSAEGDDPEPHASFIELIASGELPSFKIGSRRLIHDDDLRTCVDKFRKQSAA